jgi:serine/threonine protein kinase/peptidoglycan hydrolase-like protein with peptidoglycan-binding domain
VTDQQSMAGRPAEVDRAALAPGRVVGRYTVVSILGQGGFGITYRARDNQLGRDVAIKEYLPSSLALREGDTVVPRSTRVAEDFVWGRDRFVAEGRTLASLQRAPGIVRVFDFLEANGTAYIVMEMLQGETLEDRLKRAGPLDAAAIDRILGPLLDGLEQVHEAGFLHRDIKPANILLDGRGNPTLIDFGASRAAMAGRTVAMTAIFTPGYAAAEQFTSAKQGPWTDIYGLSATLYHAITGAAPPSAFDRMLDDGYRPLAKLAPPGISPGLRLGIDAGLAVRQTDRPQSVAGWRAILAQTAAPSAHGATLAITPTAPAATPSAPVAPPSVSAPPTKSPMLWAGVAVAVLLVAGGGAYFALAPSKPANQQVATAADEVQRAREALAAAEAKARQQAEEEARRAAEAQAKRKAEQEAADKRRAEEDARRAAAARTEQERQEAEIARKRAEQEAIARKQADEEEARRKAAAEVAEREKAAEEVRKAREALAAAEAARQQAELEALRLRTEAENRRKAEAEAAAKQQAEQDSRRKAEAEAAEKRKAEEAAAAEARQKAELEAAAKRKAEEDEKKGGEAMEAGLRLTQQDRQRIQVALTSLGFDTRGADGAFGPRSRNMIAAWQKARNHPTTGYLNGPQHQALLREATPALTKYDDEQKKLEEYKKKAEAEAKAKTDAEAKAKAPPTPAPNVAAAPPVAAAAPAAPAGLANGPYSGALLFSAPGGLGVPSVQASVTVAGNRISGNVVSAACGRFPLTLTVDASGSISGDAQAPGNACAPHSFKVNGRAEGGKVALVLDATSTLMKGRGTLTPGTAGGAAASASPPDTSAPAVGGAANGTYVGSLSLTGGGLLPSIGAVTVTIAGGRGTGTVTMARCGTEPFNFVIDASGSLTGETRLTNANSCESTAGRLVGKVDGGRVVVDATSSAQSGRVTLTLRQ